jgi:hypothetical protein
MNRRWARYIGPYRCINAIMMSFPCGRMFRFTFSIKDDARLWVRIFVINLVREVIGYAILAVSMMRIDIR